MFKRILIYLMVLATLVMILDIIYLLIKESIKDYQVEIECDGKITMVCGEYGCENLCMPVPIDRLTD